MTRQRNDSHSTEFGEWIRKQKEVDSRKGFRNYNLDYIWWYKPEWDSKQPANWMLIEEKRYMSECRPDQALTFKWLDEKIKNLNDPTYKGYHFLMFEKTSPEDGAMYWDGEEITKERLFELLRFKG
jgi:hypothetical protein